MKRRPLAVALAAAVYADSAILATLAARMLATWMARTVTKPLNTLMRATRQIVRDPEDTSAFPLPVSSANEAADLVSAFNMMVTSMKAAFGMNDTLALLDSMWPKPPSLCVL